MKRKKQNPVKGSVFFGKNLNDGPCGCAEEPKDPRMAAISDIFSKFKEV